MEEFKKNQKRHMAIKCIITAFVIIICIAGISLEVLAEIPNPVAIILFIVAFGLVLIGIVCIFVFYKMDGKVTDKLVTQLNQELEGDYSYACSIPILDLVQESMYSIPHKTLAATAIESISGKIEDISFEYYVFTFTKESLFSNDFKDVFELYIYKNVSVFSKEFFVTKTQLKKAGEFKEISKEGIYIYTKQNEEEFHPYLPGDVIFLSINQRTLYVFKKALSKKDPLYMKAQNIEEFKELVLKEINNIQKTYEKTEIWAK